MEYFFVSVAGFLGFSSSFIAYFFLCYESLISVIKLTWLKWPALIFSAITAFAFAIINLQAILKFCESIGNDTVKEANSDIYINIVIYILSLGLSAYFILPYLHLSFLGIEALALLFIVIGVSYLMLAAPTWKQFLIQLLSLFAISFLFFEYLDHISLLSSHIGIYSVYTIAAIAVFCQLLVAFYRAEKFNLEVFTQDSTKGVLASCYFLALVIGLASFVFNGPLLLGIISLVVAMVISIIMICKEQSNKSQLFASVICLALHTGSEGMFAAKGAAVVGQGLFVILLVFLIKAGIEFVIDYVPSGHDHTENDNLPVKFISICAALTIGFVGGIEAHVMFGFSLLLALAFAIATGFAEQAFLVDVINIDSHANSHEHANHEHGFPSKYWEELCAGCKSFWPITTP